MEKQFRSKNEAKLKILEEIVNDASLYDLICTVFSGDEIRFPDYWKQKNIEERNRQIRKDFESNSNVTTQELADKYMLSPSMIYKLMERKPT